MVYADVPTLFFMLVSIRGYNGLISLLPMVHTTITSYGNWQQKYPVMCLCNFLGIILGVTYNVCVGAFGGIPSYCVELISIATGMYQYLKKAKDDKNVSKEQGT